MKKKFAVIVTLIFGVLLFFGTKGYAEEDTTTKRLSFQPYFSSTVMYKNVKPFETVDFLIPKLPVISGYNVNYKFRVKTSNTTENFLVQHVSPNGQCVISEEVVTATSSNNFFGSTAGISDYGNDFLVAKVTNLSPVTLYYYFNYNYKLSKDPTDFVGL